MDGYVNREEFIQETILRERIRGLVAEVYREDAQKDLQERKTQLAEQKKLRSLISRIIVEAAEEAAPHENTGINVLADLLKNIVHVFVF